MKALNVGLVMDQGADFNLVVQINNTVAGVSAPIDITGYEFVGEMRLSTSPSVPIAGGVKASGAITFTTNPSPGDTLTINGTVITFVAATPGADEVLIGTSLEDTVISLFALLLASTDANIVQAGYAIISTNLSIVVTFTVVGLVGNAFTLAISSAGNTVSAATLLGGIDPAEFVFTILDQVTNTGQVQMSLPQAQVDTIATSVSGDLNVARLKTPYIFDVKMKDTSGLKSRIMQGIVYVSPQATQEALP